MNLYCPILLNFLVLKLSYPLKYYLFITAFIGLLLYLQLNNLLRLPFLHLIQRQLVLKCFLSFSSGLKLFLNFFIFFVTLIIIPSAKQVIQIELPPLISGNVCPLPAITLPLQPYSPSLEKSSENRVQRRLTFQERIGFVRGYNKSKQEQ
jgi:hypothetical protein